MSDPTTTNVLLAIPTRGSDPGTWDTPVNGDFNACDGYFGGVQTISASSSPIVLTAPAGTPSPGGGPTQAQNNVLRFTGTLTSNVTVTLPLPGRYIIENLTSGNFVLLFQGVTPTEIIGIDQGDRVTIYNDGANVRFADLGKPAKMEFWAGLSAMPAWVTSCTVRPWLLCDGTVYNYSAFPFLGPKLAGQFGGNGITTFAVPDMRGRLPLAYDGTGTRITAAGCGINGQTIGASLDQQTVALSLASLPTGITSTGSLPLSAATLSAPVTGFGIASFSTSTGGTTTWQAFSPGASITSSVLNAVGTVTSNNTGGVGHNNVQPSQVAGIWVIKT